MSITKLIAELDSAADNLAVIGNHGVDVVNHQAICMQVAKRLNGLEKSLEGMVLAPRGFIEVAGCPNENCTDGVVANYHGDGSIGFDCEISQCQFCYEKAAMLSIAEEAE